MVRSRPRLRDQRAFDSAARRVSDGARRRDRESRLRPIRASCVSVQWPRCDNLGFEAVTVEPTGFDDADVDETCRFEQAGQRLWRECIEVEVAFVLLVAEDHASELGETD